MKNIVFIGFASGWGAQVRGTEKGPQALKDSRVTESLPFSLTWETLIAPEKTADEIELPPGPPTLPYVQDVCSRTANAVKKTLQATAFPVVIGGDHVSAAGTWAGVAAGLNLKEKLGLIWIDAHMDAHTMETTPSQAYHGMPLAALFGQGEPFLVNILEKGATLRPEHVCLIGVRSYEEGEEALLKRLGVRVFYIEEVKERGFAAVFEEALARVKTGTDGFGLTIDLDAFDPLEVPGVGTPEPNGLHPAEVLPALADVRKDPSFKALEIVEYNPELDKGGKTLSLMRDLLETLVPRS